MAVAQTNINRANSAVDSATSQLAQLYATTTICVSNYQNQIKILNVDMVMTQLIQITTKYVQYLC